MNLEKPIHYTIRNFVKKDEKALSRILRECFGPTFTTPRRLKEWTRRLGVDPDDIFVGTVGGKLVSCVILVSKQLHHGEGVYIKSAGISDVCTDSDYRCKGIMSNIMKTALEKSRHNGLSNASLYTGLDISAHRMYERLGFVDILTWRTYVKHLNYPYTFGAWLRYLNRSLKDSKVAAKKLEGWEKSVTINLKDVGILSFRFRKGRFEKLANPPKRADIELSTDLETYLKIGRNVIQWKDAVKDGKLTLTKGEMHDIDIFKRILHWRWDD
jgi:ribosomal protein S18 acetylase RimI-like enzyme/putative sterol carrier protein